MLIVSGPLEEQAATYDAVVESGEIPRERIKSVKDRYPLYGEG